jgi:hypothetical protein
MDDRSRKIIDLKQEIEILSARKTWYSAQIAADQFSDEELIEKQDILSKIVALLDGLSKELLNLEQA